jgi:ribonucleoside-triphosphate reductase
LSFTTLNLPRFGIKAGKDWDKFYYRHDVAIKLVAEQLYQRFSMQGKLKGSNMPLLMGQWYYLVKKK